MHHVFFNKEAVQKLWCRCIMFVKKEAVQKLWCRCIMCLLKRKQFKSCGVDASCVCRQAGSLRVVVALHHVFVNKETV